MKRVAFILSVVLLASCLPSCSTTPAQPDAIDRAMDSMALGIANPNA